mgnify:CR=1 FL=1
MSISDMSEPMPEQDIPNMQEKIEVPFVQETEEQEKKGKGILDQKEKQQHFKKPHKIVNKNTGEVDLKENL